MGLDGFSMGNLGLNPELTSAQMANQAEQIARKESEIKIKDVTESAKEEGIKRKDKGPEKDNKDDSKKKKEDSEESQDDSENNLEKIDFEKVNPKEYSIRINSNTDLVELYNTKEDRAIETMSAQDLMFLISKLDSASGVIVNRKI